MEDNEQGRLHVLIPQELKDWVAIHAATQRTSITQIVVSALEQYRQKAEGRA